MDLETCPVESPVVPQARRWCPLCGQPSAAVRRRDCRCTRCGSPLAPPLAFGEAFVEGRRGAQRRDRREAALVQVGWPAPLEPVRWNDLSLSGLSFFTGRPIAPGTAVRLFDDALEAVAEVVGCDSDGPLHRVRARLLTVLFLQARGVFVSAKA